MHMWHATALGLAHRWEIPGALVKMDTFFKMKKNVCLSDLPA